MPVHVTAYSSYGKQLLEAKNSWQPVNVNLMSRAKNHQACQKAGICCESHDHLRAQRHLCSMDIAIGRNIELHGGFLAAMQDMDAKEAGKTSKTRVSVSLAPGASLPDSS